MIPSTGIDAQPIVGGITDVKDLPTLPNLGGNELFAVYINGTFYKVSLSQFAQAVMTNLAPLGSVTKAQAQIALADNRNPSGINVLPIVNGYVDPGSNDQLSYAWNTAVYILVGDLSYQLIQTSTGWNDTQMSAFMALAASEAV